MSLDGNTFSFIPYSLNGIGDAGLGTSYVPYTGSLQATDLGSQAIRTTNVPTLANDLTNKLYVDTAITASSLLPLNNTWTGTNTFNNSVITNTTLTTNTTTVSNTLTVDTTANASLSNLVRTELNNILGGYSPATITVGNDFGTITNSLGVYQATSTTTFASLVLGTLTVSEKYSVSLSLKSVDTNTTNLYLYGSTTPNMTGNTGQIVGFSIPPNTTGFTVFTNTITFPVGSTYLLLVYYSQKPLGIDTLFWNAFSVTGMGSVVKNLIAPSTGLDATNKTYVDTADALRVPYTGASATVTLGSENITTTRVPLANADLTNKLYVDTAASSLLSLNNTWTGTNTFNNTLTTGVGYTSNLNSIIQTIQTPSGQSAGNFTTVGLPSGVPAGSVLSGSYLLTAGVSSGAMGMWLGAYVYTNSQNSFTFTGMAGSQALVLYVYQYNAAGTSAVAINDNPIGYSITTSSATVSGSFLANRYSLYTGKIVFYFQALAVNQSVSFSGFFHDIGSANINGSLSITGVATETPITTIGLNASNQLIKYTNPVSSVFTGSVSSTYIPYASSANVFANSIMYQSGTQINIGGTLSTTGTITSGGDVNCVIISPSGGYGRLDDRSLRPKDINAATEQFFFASYNNDGGAPYADAIGMNGWTDSSGGNTNVLMVRKDTYGIRQYQGTFGSTTAFVNSPAGSAQYMDVCMKGVGDNTKTVFQPIGGTWNVPLNVGSGTDSGGAQLITTNGNIHIDCATGTEIYIGYYRTPLNIRLDASNSIIKLTRYQYHYANVDGDAMAYFQNASAGSSAYFNLIIANNAGNVNHFINSSTRTADGGVRCYTIRNDTFGGVRFMGSNGGFSSYDQFGTGGATYCNAISNYTSTNNNGGAGWATNGYTLFCNTSQPSTSQPALALGTNNYDSTWISSLAPGVRWMASFIWAANTYIYVNGSLSAYTVGGGWVNVSDAREKEDINDLKTSRSLERIMKCKPKYYKRKYYDTDKDGKDATPVPQSIKDTICIGLLAQDVLQTNPHCVSGWKNESIKETDEDDGSRYGISYNDFTVHLIGAVQEQQKQIETLSQRSVILESHARDLEKQLADTVKSLEDYKALTDERFNKLVALIQKK